VVRKKPTPSFEEALVELESLVETMEKGDMTLEQSLQSYERGVVLARICQQALQAAEQKVRVLGGSGVDAPLETFSADD
jgi:exodeoxyribonuclease VII small subunit